VSAALLDTSVLWPSTQRDFLLSLAAESMYRPIWSGAILAELEFHEAAKLRRHASAEEAQRRAEYLVDQIRQAFDDAEVAGWEGLEGSYGLPDPDDEHVVAAAVVGGAGAIVTANLKHFPPDRLPSGLHALSAAEFAGNTVSLDPARSRVAVERIAGRSGQEERERFADRSLAWPTSTTCTAGLTGCTSTCAWKRNGCAVW
jgi:hypothetical protein